MVEELNLLPRNYFQEGEFSAASDKTSREKGSGKNSSPKVKKRNFISALRTTRMTRELVADQMESADLPRTRFQMT